MLCPVFQTTLPHSCQQCDCPEQGSITLRAYGMVCVFVWVCACTKHWHPHPLTRQEWLLILNRARWHLYPPLQAAWGILWIIWLIFTQVIVKKKKKKKWHKQISHTLVSPTHIPTFHTKETYLYQLVILKCPISLNYVKSFKVNKKK